MSSQWLEIIESSLGSSLDEDLAEKISLGQFRSLLPDLIRFHNATMLPSRTSAQLRPRLDGDGSWRAVSGLKTTAPKPLQAMVKSLLLLADSVALQDPLVEAWLIGADDAERLVLLRQRLRDTARMADLIRAGVVIVYSPPGTLISANSGYNIDRPSVLGQVNEIEEHDLCPAERQAFQAQGLQFDWDAAWIAHALRNGAASSFADSLALVKSTTAGRRLFFRGDRALTEQVKGVMWEHRVRGFYQGLCDPGPMSPSTADLFCSILRLLRQVISSRDELLPADYYFLLTNPLLRADALAVKDIISLRLKSAEFSQWRDLIRQSLDYAYHAEHKYLDQHAEFVKSVQGEIDDLKSQMLSGRRGRVLSQSLDIGEVFTVGGVVGLAQYFLHADLEQSLIAAPVAAVGTIVYRVLRTFCLEKSNSIQAHYVAFRQ